MKLSFLFLFIGINLCFSAESHSQRTNFNFTLRNVTVRQVLNTVEKNSDYVFFYYNGVVNLNRRVSVTASGKNIHELLDELFVGTNNGYTINGRQISIYAKPEVAKLSAIQPPVKTIKIGGTVYDETKNPMPGVSIRIVGKEATSGTITDVTGHFILNVPNKKSIIEISSVGYKTQRLVVGSETNFIIQLQEDVAALNEVVVVGYGTTSRKNLTTSISTVKTDKISKSASPTVQGLLLGRVAGVQSTVTSTQPGGAINISIRGGGNPVYVIDGVVMPNTSLENGNDGLDLPSNIQRNGLVGLNPSDIESIEVLKDASAAIYGIGAADGVVLITTKKGSEGKPTITYEGSYSFQKRYKYGVPRLNSREYMNMVNVFNKELYLYNNNQYPYGNIVYDGKWTPLYTQDQIDNAIDTDWVGEVMRTGHINNHNISINGGTQEFKYYLGLNYYDEVGIVRNSGMKRYTLRTNISAQLFPFLRLTTIVNLNSNSYDNALVGGDTSNKAENAAGSLYTAFIYPPNYPIKDTNGEYTLLGMIPNPVATLAIKDESEQNGFYANFAADLDIIKNMLSARFVYGVTKDNSRRSGYIPSDVFFNLAKKSRGSISSSERQYVTLEGMINFNHSFGKLLDVNAVVGMGKYVEKTNGLIVNYENAKDIINDANLAAADGPFSPVSYKTENEKRSQFARASLSFLDRYILSGTIRRDGTDKFFDNKKYSWFPSVSAAWKITDEPFMRDLTWLNLLKLRASYGETGSDNLGTTLYGTIGICRDDVKFSEGSVTYVPYLLRSATYTDVTWQKTTMKNIGLDFYVLNNRLSGSIDVFRNDVTNMLGTAYTSLLNMLPTRPINGAHFKRTGMELSLNSENIKTREFLWTTSLALSHYKATWIERMPNYDYQTYQVRKNEPMNAYYFYDTDGIINMDRSNMPDSQRSLPDDAQKPGFPIIKDKNGDGTINEEDICMKDMLPKLYFGFGNTFTWKNWDLDIYIYGQLGVDKINTSLVADSRGDNMGSVLAPNKSEYIYNTWNSQTNPNGTLPGIANRNVVLPGGCGYKTYYENANFLRVRNITLGYTFDALKWSFLHGYVRSMRVFMDVQNPFTFTKYSDNDPEIVTASANLSNCNYPQLRTYTFGVKIVF